MPEVFWSILPDVSVGEYAFSACLAVASRAGNMGYSYMTSGRYRTDVARNKLCSAFRNYASDPFDVLVMLDCDHVHPHDIIERLVDHEAEKGVVGALAFRRGDPYYPCFFLRGQDGKIYQPLQFTGKLMPCAIVGTGAIAIRKWVLDALAEAGYPAPFSYIYTDEMHSTGEYESEDVTFGKLCESIGVTHWCDTGLVTPHLTTSAIDQSTWEMVAEHLIAEKHRQNAEFQPVLLPLDAGG